MALSTATLAEYMKLGLNIYITGEAGTGKTMGLKAAAQKAGFELGYLSAPTLDAYVDLVGIPIATRDKELKKRVLEFVRKKEFQDIEVLFIDELPRGEVKTLNAIFELVQFGTINGDIAMPKLKSVVAAGNPMTDDYQGQQQLDYALLDRFDIYLETDIDADLSYFIKAFGAATGKALVSWHKNHDHKEKGYLSPRRLEKIGHTWTKIPTVATIKAMVPPGGTFAVDLLHKALVQSVEGDKLRDDPTAPLIRRIPFMADDEIRANRVDILDILPRLDRAEVAQVTEAVARSLKNGTRVATIVRDWAPALEYFSPTDKITLMANWPASRNAEFTRSLLAAEISIGKNLRDLN